MNYEPETKLKLLESQLKELQISKDKILDIETQARDQKLILLVSVAIYDVRIVEIECEIAFLKDLLGLNLSETKV